MASPNAEIFSDVMASPLPRSETNFSHNYSLLDYYGTDGYDLPDHDSQTSFVDVGRNGAAAQNEENVEASPDHAEEAQNDTIENSHTEEVRTAPDPKPVTLAVLDYKPVVQKVDVKSILKSDYDMYGFKKELSFLENSKEQYNQWFSEYAAQLATQKKKWYVLLKNNGLGYSSTDFPTRFPPKSDKAKKLVRKGIPPEWRGEAWFFYAGGLDRLHKNVGVYEKIVADTQGVTNKDTEVIERDLNRTFPDNIHFNSLILHNERVETEKVQSLRRVLVAFAHYQPQIGYCQSLNFLAGLLLLFMNEERSFWMLVIMTERILPKVHSANLEGVHTDQGVLMLCVKEYIPRLWQIIGKSFEGTTLSEDKILTRLPPVSLVTLSWFMSVFVGVLPIESVLRIWDILWYEGSKTIFRISLTIFRLCLDHPQILNEEKRGDISELEQIELFQFLQSFPKTITDPNLLVDKCFKKIGGFGFGFLSQDEINKCREFVAQQRSKLKKKAVVTAEMSDMERDALKIPDSSEIHDVYGFHKSVMNGVAWNKHLSSKMKSKFRKHRS